MRKSTRITTIRIHDCTIRSHKRTEIVSVKSPESSIKFGLSFLAFQHFLRRCPLLMEHRNLDILLRKQQSISKQAIIKKSRIIIYLSITWPVFLEGGFTLQYILGRRWFAWGHIWLSFNVVGSFWVNVDSFLSVISDNSSICYSRFIFGLLIATQSVNSPQ